MGRIRVLDEQTANLIAAGEVVERPASVVKELAENALDAGATRVTVEVEDGGLRLIRVIDDGSGMDRQDAGLCLERHATSKIRDGHDLAAIHTLGFRGEALPSIASVARLEILTRPGSEVAGTRVSVEGGRDVQVEDAGCPAGTRITVRDLFFNTPARLKYLKAPGSEFGQVSDVFTRLALSRPDVAFQLVNGGATVASTPGTGALLDAIGSLYGSKLARSLVAVRGEFGPFTVAGYTAKPEGARANRSHQHFFVNGRYIKGSSLRFPVEEAYRNLLMTGRFPAFFLALDVAAGELDVNVHPSKAEVRFSQEREAKAALYRAVQDALAMADLVPKVTEQSDSTWSLLGGLGEAAAAYLGVQPAAAYPGVQPAAAYPGTQWAGAYAGAQPPAVYPGGSRVAADEGVPMPHPELLSLRPLGQVLRLYIVADGPDGLYLIDQHAAHERVYFERFSRELELTAHGASQSLLIPLELDLAPAERPLFEGCEGLLTGTGFEFTQLSGGTLMVTAVPALIGETAAPGFLRDFLDRLGEGAQAGKALDMGLEMKRAMAACKAAIKAHDVLTLPEMQALIYQLALAEQPYTCPHGRPTIISMTEAELERRFKRTGA